MDDAIAVLRGFSKGRLAIAHGRVISGIVECARFRWFLGGDIEEPAAAGMRLGDLRQCRIIRIGKAFENDIDAVGCEKRINGFAYMMAECEELLTDNLDDIANRILALGAVIKKQKMELHGSHH